MSIESNVFSGLSDLIKIGITDEAAVGKLFEGLLDMDISTPEKAKEFQRQKDHISKHWANEWAESYFLMTADVADTAKKERQEHVDQVINPFMAVWDQKLKEKFLKEPVVKSLEAPFDILRRNLTSEAKLFRKENVEIGKKSSEICSQITELQGKLKVTIQGKEMAVPEAYPLMESTDREVRKEAYEATLAANISICDEIDEKFDKLLALREESAKNAGYKDYTKFRFEELQRFDWNEKDCFEFHAAVKKHIIPIAKSLTEKRAKELGVESVRPYDTSVDMYGREPLEIYTKGDTADLINGAGKIVKAIDEELYEFFLGIKKNNLFDLDARENKAPGGYMLSYPVFQQASVFYNGAGMASDLMVLLHELGHCFHYFLGKDVEPFPLQNWTAEVAEGGSMSMEYMGLENLEEYVTADQAERMKEDKLQSIVGLFVSCSKGDEFQHWVYANPKHTVEERRSKLAQLNEEYSTGVDTTGYDEQMAKTNWQYVHILQMPYYLIDYCISELLALSIWDRYKTDREDGVKNYKQGCSLAASRGVPELYQAFGTTLNFGDKVIAPLAERLKSELKL